MKTLEINGAFSRLDGTRDILAQSTTTLSTFNVRSGQNLKIRRRLDFAPIGIAKTRTENKVPCQRHSFQVFS
jgi:hypothetical protein